MPRNKPQPAPDAFAASYPHIAEWVREGNWVELGQTDWTRTFARALDEGGRVWEGRASYATLDEALRALDEGIRAWVATHG